MVQTPDISIRYIKEEDYKEVVSLAKEVVALVLPEEKFEEEFIRNTFLQALKNKECTGIVLVINGYVEGYVLGMVTPNYFHPKVIALCTSIYVRPRYRKYGLWLIKAFESWGKYRQAKTLSISSYPGLSPKGLDRVFTRLGYTQKEINFQKEI